jgi:hypothetical protein
MSQAGVKTLLDAEQKAQEIVNKARRGKYPSTFFI